MDNENIKKELHNLNHLLGLAFNSIHTILLELEYKEPKLSLWVNQEIKNKGVITMENEFITDEVCE